MPVLNHHSTSFYSRIGSIELTPRVPIEPMLLLAQWYLSHKAYIMSRHVLSLNFYILVTFKMCSLHPPPPLIRFEINEINDKNIFVSCPQTICGEFSRSSQPAGKRSIHQSQRTKVQPIRSFPWHSGRPPAARNTISVILLRGGNGCTQTRK